MFARYGYALRRSSQLGARYSQHNLPPAYLQLISEFEREADFIREKTRFQFGYPSNLKEIRILQTSVREACLSSGVVNNCLEPFSDTAGSHWKSHTQERERELVLTLSSPWKLNDAQNVWGYITTGGTEGNLKGLQTGLEQTREARRRIVIFSEASHFSVEKVVKQSAEDFVKVKQNADGSMNLEDLQQVLHVAKRMDCTHVVVLATLGTTFLGANDDLEGIQRVVTSLFAPNHFYLHLDAALHGGFWQLDFTTKKYKLGRDFHSFSVSGYKWYGGFVAGCFFTESTNAVLKSGIRAEYLGLLDKTASGSKDGIIPLLWLARLKQFDWAKEYQYCVEMKKEFMERVQELGITCYSHQHSLIVVFPAPNSATCDLFQLATVSNDQLAHCVVLPHWKKSDIDAFVDRIKASGEAEQMKRKQEKFKLDPSNAWPIPM